MLAIPSTLVSRYGTPEQQAAFQGNPGNQTSSAVSGVASLLGGIFHHTSKSQQAYLDLAMAGSVHDATAIAEFASNNMLPDWPGWESAWETLIAQNPAIAVQGYALARSKPQLNPVSGSFQSSTTGITQVNSGPAAGGGITDTLAQFFSKITAPSANTAAAAAGQAAAKQAQSTLVTIGLLVAGAIVLGAIILRRR